MEKATNSMWEAPYSPLERSYILKLPCFELCATINPNTIRIAFVGQKVILEGLTVNANVL